VIGNAGGEVELFEDCALTFLEVSEGGNPDIIEVENHFQFHLRL
jgi:hypothetical protein